MDAYNAATNGTNSPRQIIFAIAMAVMAPYRMMASGPAPVDLGSTAQFAILAASAITSTGGGQIYGDVGLSPGGGSSIGVIQTQTHGVIYAVDALGPVGSVMAPALLTAAKNDLTAAYNDAAARTPVPVDSFLNPGGGNIGGLNLVPGLYKFTAGALISSDVTLTGGSDDVWIFQMGTDLTVGSGVNVILAGGAAARNIFWQVGSSATLDTFCDFKGTIMADQSITMNTSCTVEGRALARIAMVTFNGARINLPLAAPAKDVGGRVWLDEDADAVQDAGEAGIANVVVQLLDTNSVVVAETLTDIEGRYLFTGQNAGAYIVRVETASMPDGLAANQTYDPDATLDHQTVIALSSDVPTATADFGYNWTLPARLYGYAYQDKDLSLTRSAGDGSASGMVVQVWLDGVLVASTNANAAGYYEFDGLVPGTYEVRFISNTQYLTAMPTEGAAATDPERNRAAATDQGYAVVTYDVYSGHGMGEDEGEPVNAGFRGSGPMNSANDLLAYQGADGVYVEFVAYDVEEDGTITLYLLGPDGQVIWSQSENVEAGPRQVCRFRVPGLVLGNPYNFIVRDEVGKIWQAPGVTVGAFVVDLVRMSLAGVTLAFNSLPEREYEIQWTARLGTPFVTVTNVPSQGDRTSVIVVHPDPGSPSGFFRIRVR